MTVRTDLRNELLAYITQLFQGSPNVHVEAWRGDAHFFNASAHETLIAVGAPPAGQARVIFGEDDEIGAATYERTLYFGVYVGTTDANNHDGEAEADELLETLEGSLHDLALTTGQRLELGTGPRNAETLIASQAGRRLYGQVYKIEAPVSRA